MNNRTAKIQPINVTRLQDQVVALENRLTLMETMLTNLIQQVNLMFGSVTVKAPSLPPGHFPVSPIQPYTVGDPPSPVWTTTSGGVVALMKAASAGNTNEHNS